MSSRVVDKTHSVPKSVSLPLRGYQVRGSVKGFAWDGTKGWIPMRPYLVHGYSMKDVLPGLNDGGFGLESVTEAWVKVFAIYGSHKGGYEVQVAEYILRGDDVADVKRGV